MGSRTGLDAVTKNICICINICNKCSMYIHKEFIWKKRKQFYSFNGRGAAMGW